MIIKQSKLLANSVALLLVSQMSFAEQQQPVSDAVAPGDSDSRWVLGASLVTFGNPYIGEQTNETYILPNIEYRGERFFVSKDDIGLTLFRLSGFSGGLILSGSYSFFDDKDNYKDNVKLAGIQKRDSTLDAGLYLVHNSELGQLRIRLLEEVSQEHDGNRANVSYTFDFEAGEWSVNPFVEVSWLSGNTVDYFFGVSQLEANQYRAAYKGSSSTNISTGIRGRYEFNEHWDMNVMAAYTRFGSGITDSTLIEEDDTFISSVGVNYNF